MNKKLLIGWSEKDITPDVLGKRIPLYGLYYARIAQGIHARLKCVSAAFAKSSEHFVNCTLDNAGYLRQLLDRVRQLLGKKVADLYPEIIFLNAINSPRAPSLAFNAVHTGAAAAWRAAEQTENIPTPDEYADFAIPVIADCIDGPGPYDSKCLRLSGSGDFHAGYLPGPDAEKFSGPDGGYKLADRIVEKINQLFD